METRSGSIGRQSVLPLAAEVFAVWAGPDGGPGWTGGAALTIAGADAAAGGAALTIAGADAAAGGAGGVSRPTIPFFDQAVAAGFPSPAADHEAVGLDLTHLLIRHPAATFMLRVMGDSMTGAGILDGDLAIVDRSLEARPGHVVVAVVDGDFVLKRLRLRGGRLFLDAENPDFTSCVLPGEGGFEIWGVVTATVRRYAGHERGRDGG